MIIDAPVEDFQSCLQVIDGQVVSMSFPSPSAEVLPSVCWGRFDVLLTPAFWATRVWLDQGHTRPQDMRLGDTFTEEVTACLLGGYGVPAEIGNAAFQRLRESGILQSTASPRDIEDILSEPITYMDRKVRYRFPRQKANYIAHALQRLAHDIPPSDDAEFRDWLSTFTGIGLKTASWITRNWLESDDVAIIDVHIQRAGIAAGFFKPNWKPATDYHRMESAFLAFSKALEVRPSMLDHLMWHHMRLLGNIGRQH